MLIKAFQSCIYSIYLRWTPTRPTTYWATKSHHLARFGQSSQLWHCDALATFPLFWCLSIATTPLWLAAKIPSSLWPSEQHHCIHFDASYRPQPTSPLVQVMHFWLSNSHCRHCYLSHFFGSGEPPLVRSTTQIDSPFHNLPIRPSSNLHHGYDCRQRPSPSWQPMIHFPATFWPIDSQILLTTATIILPIAFAVDHHQRRLSSNCCHFSMIGTLAAYHPPTLDHVHSMLAPIHARASVHAYLTCPTGRGDLAQPVARLANPFQSIPTHFG